MPVHSRRTLLALLVALGLLLLVAPHPAAALEQLRGVGSAADPTEPLVAAVCLAAWALALWLLLAALLVLAARAPGAVGRAAAATARRIAPAVLRGALEVALGVGVGVGVAGAAVPAAASGPAAPAASASATAGPAASEAPVLPSLDWPGPARPAEASAPAPSAGGGRPDDAAPQVAVAAVVVEPGDSLWALAEAHLVRARGTRPTAAQVAVAWPQWWSANREVVGDDPDLILPGTVLQPPGR